MEVNGIIQVISEVYYIPDLKNNLISMGQLQDKGVTILIKNGTCKVFHETRGIIMQSDMSPNRMFVVFASMIPVIPKITACLQAMTEDEGFLWHCRFAHISFTGLKTLQTRDMVRGLPTAGMADASTGAKVCTTCLAGKQHREVFPKKSLWRA